MSLAGRNACADEINSTSEQNDYLTGTPEEIYPTIAQTSGGYDDVFFLMEQQLITVASKMEEEVSKAPSIVTVITAKEIENMGFRTLPEVLRTVPGFDIIKDATFGRIWTGARGIRDADNKIRVLIDGHSLNMPYNGGIAYPFDDLPLKNVKKIEIIRGPGSALYGANAFLAVIT